MSERFTKKQLMELYKLYIDRENEIRRSWRQFMQFYITTCLSIFAGMMLISNLSENIIIIKIAIIGGGIFMFGISIVAYFHFKLDYLYQMELLSIECKIEDILGLTDENNFNLPLRWNKEALLPKYFYSEKNEISSSEAFIKKMISWKKINFYPFIYVFLALFSIGVIIIGVII